MWARSEPCFVTIPFRGLFPFSSPYEVGIEDGVLDGFVKFIEVLVEVVRRDPGTEAIEKLLNSIIPPS